MKTFEFQIEKPLLYDYTGKFKAPSENWMHTDEFPLVDYELMVVTEDTLYLTYAHEDYIVPAGSFLVLPPAPYPLNKRKGFRPSACSFYWLHFETNLPMQIKNVLPTQIDYINSLPKDTISIPCQGVLPNQEKVVVLMKQLHDAVRNNYTATVFNYMTTVILCEIHSQLNSLSSDWAVSKKTQKQIYHDIIDYIKTNVKEPLKVNDIAKHFGYSDKYLSHLFSKIAGVSLKQFILTTKMDTANFMLTDTNNSIAEIANELSFSDGHSFARAYRRIYGMTPTEYRNAFSQRLLYHE